MRVSFLRAAEAVFVGGWSVRIGPWRIRWGVRWLPGSGRYYTVGPISFFDGMQLCATLVEEGYGPALAGGKFAPPAGVVRACASLLVGQPVRDCDLRRASVAQLMALWTAFCRANDWPEIAKQMEPAKDSGRRAAPQDDDFDWSVYVIAKQLGMWPYEVMRLPYCEVQAVIRAIRRDYGATDEKTSQFVVERAKAQQAERDRATEKLRKLGLA